jgi:hypothetical protein
MKKRPHKSSRPVGKSAAGRSATWVRLRQAADGTGWEFLHPRCALDRAEDLEEVRKMIEANELEVATDEVRWLLGGCTDYIEAHKTLGELALLSQDIPLARGHFGYAYQIGFKAWQSAGKPTPLPYVLPANHAFFEAGKGLAYCLKELNKPKMLADVVATLATCDPTDPLNVKGFLS